MKITMLYYSTICKWADQYKLSWDQINSIEDNDNMVKYGDNNEFSCSLAHMFYCTHMGGFDETTDHARKLLSAFLKACKCTDESEV